VGFRCGTRRSVEFLSSRRLSFIELSFDITRFIKRTRSTNPVHVSRDIENLRQIYLRTRRVFEMYGLDRVHGRVRLGRYITRSRSRRCAVNKYPLINPSIEWTIDGNFVPGPIKRSSPVSGRRRGSAIVTLKTEINLGIILIMFTRLVSSVGRALVTIISRRRRRRRVKIWTTCRVLRVRSF